MNLDELKAEVILLPRPAGQYAGVTRTGVKVTHIPTGLSAYCDSKWSECRNKEVALAMVKRGYEIQQGEGMPSPMKTHFYVYRIGNKAPTIKHPSLDSAVIEAERLARQHPEETFEILQCIAVTRAVESRTFWMDEVNPPLQYTGHVLCRKCGEWHWMHGPCSQDSRPKTQEPVGGA